MYYRNHRRGRAAATAIAILLSLSAITLPADARTLTLRLDDQPVVKPSSGGAPVSDVINVPSVRSNPVPKPSPKCASAALVDEISGQVLYSKNPDLKLPNASTTKIMTALLLIENCRMSDKITASKKASETPTSSIFLQPGEKISVQDALYALMLRSANDAAVAVAEHIGGSTARFAAMMNKRALEIGCRNTRFVTPNGLPAKGHYSSARDLCTLARRAVKYPVFNEVVNTRKHLLESRTKNRKDLAVFRRSKFMENFPGADGVKSGYTREAGQCYVGSASRDGWRLVATVLKSENAAEDTAALMNYGFANFRPVDVVASNDVCANIVVEGGDKEAVPAVAVGTLRVIVPKSGGVVRTRLETEPLEAPVAKDVKVGRLIASLDGNDVASVDLRAAESVKVSFGRRTFCWFKNHGLILVGLLIGGKYAGAIAESSRRRRRRVTSSLRGFDRLR